jgi:hypothetical protein
MESEFNDWGNTLPFVSFHRIHSIYVALRFLAKASAKIFGTEDLC